MGRELQQQLVSILKFENLQRVWNMKSNIFYYFFFLLHQLSVALKSDMSRHSATPIHFRFFFFFLTQRSDSYIYFYTLPPSEYNQHFLLYSVRGIRTSSQRWVLTSFFTAAVCSYSSYSSSSLVTMMFKGLIRLSMLIANEPRRLSAECLRADQPGCLQTAALCLN